MPQKPLGLSGAIVRAARSYFQYLIRIPHENGKVTNLRKGEALAEPKW
jgi:hypothetical protein